MSNNINSKESNKISKADLDITTTISLIIKSMFLDIYFFIICKLFKLKAKFSNTDLNNNLFMKVIEIKMVGSNHDRRRQLGFIFIIKLIEKCIFWRNISKKSTIYFFKKQPIRFYKASCSKSYFNFENFNDKLILCGDSHVEYFSRINLVNTLGEKVIPKSIWLGPKTLIGFSSDLKSQHYLFEIIKRIKKKNSYLIFSLGSIDIRTTFGYLMATKSINTEEDFYDIFERSYISFYEVILSKIKEHYIKEMAFLSIPPVSPLKGINIRRCSYRKAIEYQKNVPFSVFGSPKERALCTKNLNNRLQKISYEKGWNFINNEKAYQSIQLRNNNIIEKKYSYDLTHITEPNVYSITLNNIILFFEKKNKSSTLHF